MDPNKHFSEKTLCSLPKTKPIADVLQSTVFKMMMINVAKVSMYSDTVNIIYHKGGNLNDILPF